MVYKSLVRDHDFVVKTFDFPDGGSVALCDKQFALLKEHECCTLKLSTVPLSIDCLNNHFFATFSDGSQETFSNVIVTCHLGDLSKVIKSPNINLQVINQGIERLKYRSLVLVNLVFDRECVRDFKEHWIDVHDASIKTLRVTNFSNYNFDNSNVNHIGIGLEYNCFDYDPIWSMDDMEIFDIAMRDLLKMQLVQSKPVEFSVLKFDKAYPVYFKGFEEPLNIIQREFSKVNGLYFAGRNALYRWNNMHHSVKTGILSARNCLGESNNLNDVKGLVSFGKDSD